MPRVSRISRRDFLKTTAIAGAGLVAASCGAKPPTGGGNLRGITINYLGWEGYDYAGALAPLVEEYGITINSTYGGNNEEIFSKLKAGSPGQYDVISIYHGNVPALVANDLVQPLDISRLEHWEDIMPAFKNQPWQVYDGNVYPITFTWGTSQPVYNPKYVPEGIPSWNIMLDPKYKGRIVQVDNVTSDPYAALLAIGVDIRNLITKDQLAAAMEWLKQVKPNIRVMVPSYGEMADVMAREECWLTMVAWTAIIGWVAEKGVTLATQIPQEGAAGWADNYLIPKGANLDAAYAFINQMTSPFGQAELAKYLNQMMTNRKVVDLLPEDMAAQYATVEEDLQRIPFPPDPPLETDDPNIATFADWTAAWEEYKAYTPPA